ncbi:nucleoside phosphorylase [Mucilaginibacter sp. HMF5004]|uniref:nucleoside phosphorylase n=1 Tax=Mucilaginibacter rivuli TaxID=2857527 RepID=UPI001C5CCD32|nr:nucleoside phosphorylase [Mucilaginibacter rivuli]MBW4889571.1 nucleoside phosphorylase [Mucilaginibacter rivuli]
MNRIAESELIVNSRGAIYHLDVKPDEISTNIITVGDPDRVGEVSKHFDKVEVKRAHREFVTHTGYIGKKRVSVVSTGIGTDNIDIVFNELDALVNIDFATRTVNQELKQLSIIRIGTSGSLQRDFPVDSFLASTHGLGIDNLMNFYDVQANDTGNLILNEFITQTGLSGKVSAPYINACDEGLLKQFDRGFHKGITVTCPGFYGPQGRVLRLGLSNPGFIDKLSDFKYKDLIISNFEMETAGIYGLGAALGHKTISLNALIANRITGAFSKDPGATVNALIEKTLGIIASN